MSVEQTCVPGVSSRRFACDRCRGQKLRCLREHANQQSCDRCLRANAECRTSPIFRVRSYLGNGAATSNDDGGERAPKRLRLRHYNAPQLQIPSHGATPHPSREREPAATIETMHRPALLADATPMSMFDASLTSSNIPELSGNFSALNTAGGMHWEAENSIFYDMLSDGTDKSYGFFGSTRNSPENSRSQGSSLIQDLTSQPVCSLTSSLQTPSSTSKSSLQSADNHRDDLAADPDANIIDMNPEDQVTSSGTADSEPEETYIQRLSRINLNLVTLRAQIDKGSPAMIIETLVGPMDESASPRTTLDDMLNGTREFLEVLSQLAGPSRRPSMNPISSNGHSPVLNYESNASRSSSRKQPSSYASSLFGREDNIAPSPTGSLPSSTSTPPSTSNAQPRSKLDFASLLLVLTSYIYLVRLYEVLFAQMHDYLKEISDSNDPYLCPLPNLSFCSFPLQSGNLQIIILIQIVTSLFERMERLLGLPQEFRINSRGGGAEGLLSDEEFVDIVKMVFRKRELSQSENRRGGVKALRKHLKKIKQLLRDSIDL